MTQSAKTITMVAVAAAMLLLAILAAPKAPYVEKEGEVGQLLFKDWKPASDPAKSVEIATFDELQPDRPPFKVAFVDGQWSIPSHGDYPANVEKRVNEVAKALANLKIVDVVSDAAASHELYGVVDPDKSKLKGLPVGVGKLVIVKDAAGKDLARLIIGKEDKSKDTESSGLWFVRRGFAGEDRVYSVKLPADLFSTNFQDWIDPDLLDIKQHWDIAAMKIRDYTFDEQQDRLGITRQDDLSLQYDDKGSSWAVKQLIDYKNNQPVEAKLGPDEEIDSAKLNEAKTNLSGIKIVDVERKPAGFAEKLKTGKSYLEDPEAQNSLAEGRFFALPEGKPTDIFSAGNDMTVGMKDGVEYTVRFGGVGISLHGKETGKAKSSDKDKKGAKRDSEEEKRIRTERFVFVTARFNEDLLTKPVLKPLPEPKKPDGQKPAEGKPAETKPGSKEGPAKSPPETKAPETSVPDTKAPESKAPESKAPEIKAPEGKAPENKSPDSHTPATKPDEAKKSAAARRPEMLLALANEPTTSPPAKAATDAKPADAKTPEAGKPAEPPAADNKAPEKKAPEKKAPESGPAAKQPDDKTPSAEPPKTTPADAKQPAAEKKPVSDIKRADEEKALDDLRKQIEAENKQLTDQYDATVKRGKQRAKELNDRFADWYYLISEDDYKKAHVTKAEIIKKKAPPEGAAAPSLGPGLKDPFQSGHGAIPEEK